MDRPGEPQDGEPAEVLRLPVPGQRAPAPGVKAFLFADIRGYTSFTATRGSEAAARVSDLLVALAGSVAADHDGHLRGSWGDQVLVEFASPRRAMRAAADLQDRCVAATVEDPSAPLLVGIGLDIGEPDEGGQGRSASGLNVASRLCAVAAAGQVLATAELAHTAGVIEGHAYVDRGRLRLKGVPRPTRVVQVSPAKPDEGRTRRYAAVQRALRDRKVDRSLRRWAAALAVAAVVAGAGGWAVSRLVASPKVHVVADSVALVDEGSLRVKASVPVGSGPEGVASGFGSVWAVNEASGSVARVSVATHQRVETVPVGRVPRAVAAGAGGVWVTNSADRTVSWISPRTNTVVKTIAVGNAPTGVAVAGGTVWVSNSLDDTVSAIDASSGTVTATVPVGRRPTGVAVGLGDLWVADSGGASVSRIDVATRSVVATITVGNGPERLAAGTAGVWVANSLDGTVSHIDPVDDHVAATFPVGRSAGGIAISHGRVWVTSELDGRLTAIDPAQDRIVRTLALGGGPRDVVPVNDGLWVTEGGSPTAHRGGTLRGLGPGLFGSIDPTSSPLPWEYDGLLTYRRADGPDGSTIVPDLATSLPTLSDGGRTYTFHVRRGIRYSDGRLVRASDLRRGLQRALVVDGFGGGDIPKLYAGIVGAKECLRSPEAPCALPGVVADDAAATVTIRLTRHDGSFLYKLAFPTPVAVAPGTPSHDVGARPAPSTGPYRIVRFVPRHLIVLRRNPYFHEWSRAAQPDGLPDRFVFGTASDPVTIAEVLAGRADVGQLGNGQDLGRIATRTPDELHIDLSPIVDYLALDTTAAPFRDRRVRRAVALAVDRTKVVRALGGRLQYAPTCRMLPPTFPGFRPGCALGHPTEQATARARRLVRASGATDARLTVLTADTPVTDYLVDLLRSLGFRHVTGSTGNPYGPPPGPLPSLRFWGYGSLYPSPDGVYDPLMQCGVFFNAARVCDRQFLRDVAAARDRQVTDPAGAAADWRAIEDRALADAAYIPVSSEQFQAITARQAHGYARSTILGSGMENMWVGPSLRPRQLAPALRPDRRLASVATRATLDAVPSGAGLSDPGDWLVDPPAGQVRKVDPTTGRVIARVRLADPETLAVGLGGVWVSRTDVGRVTRLDPSTGTVTADIAVGPSPQGIAIAGGRVWVADGQTGRLSAIDPHRDRVVRTIRGGPPAFGFRVLVATGDRLWISDTLADDVRGVDPAGGRPVTVVRLPTTPGQVDNVVAAGAGALWRTDAVAGAVLRIDPATGRVVTRIRVRLDAQRVAVFGGAVWVFSGNLGYGVLSRIDPRTEKIVATLSVGPVDDLVPGHGLWAVAFQEERALRIGTAGS